MRNASFVVLCCAAAVLSLASHRCTFHMFKTLAAQRQHSHWHAEQRTAWSRASFPNKREPVFSAASCRRCAIVRIVSMRAAAAAGDRVGDRGIDSASRSCASRIASSCRLCTGHRAQGTGHRAQGTDKGISAGVMFGNAQRAALHTMQSHLGQHLLAELSHFPRLARAGGVRGTSVSHRLRVASGCTQRVVSGSKKWGGGGTWHHKHTMHN
jgi:hypothetical protein